MNPIKINISAEVREFNEQVEHADFMTDYKHDRQSADVLLICMQDLPYPASARALERAIVKLSIKR